MDYASKVFERAENPNSLLYTALIGGQVAAGCYLDAIRFYARMIEASVMPNPAVLSSLLKACGCLLALSEARELHGQVLKLGLGNERVTRMKLMEFYAKCGEFEDAHRIFAELPERDVVASTVMISCYSGHGLVEKARGIFDKIPAKDTICWTAMIDGLVQNGQMNEALELFREMQREEVRPNKVTIVCLLSACSHLGALEIGRWIHSYVGKYNIKLNVFVGSVLIGMYSKCGSMEEAERVFHAMPKRDVVTYNSMIVGLALHGKSRKALEMFRQMIEQGVRPTHISFVGVLNACSHGGLVEMGYKMFGSMNKDFGLEPQIEHYGCMVDLLGHVGQLEEAYHFVRRMKVEPDNVIWGALLSACKIHGNLDLGERVAKIIVEKGIADSGTYILMSGVYASSGKWELAARARAKMKEMGIQKEPGCSSIVVNNEIHEFILGDIRHSQRKEIYKTLEDLNALLKAEGYCPETKVVLQDIEEGDKEWALAIHSERLAICYGLIQPQQGPQ